MAFAVETHLHADFISGSRELAAFGAAIIAPRESHLATEYRGLGDGEEVDLGGLTLRALATPGHTPEHLSYLLLDGPKPLALFSGGAVLPGGAARPDLIGPEQTEPLAHDLYRSAHKPLTNLPDDLPVYPTHGAGSFCSAGVGGQRTTTLGKERNQNLLFSAANEGVFVRTFLSGLGTYPPYFLRLRTVNQRGARLYGVNPPELARLSAEDFRRHQAAGAIAIDVRPLVDFAGGHIPGAQHLELGSVLASAGAIPAGPLTIYCGHGERAMTAASLLEAQGRESLAVLDGGFDAWRSADRPVAIG